MTSPTGLWSEGDTLSPTNLNRRNPVGTFPAKTYHVAWATGTGTTQINNAIVNAATGGYTAVFIDASRLPYDASAVTFNDDVRLYAEGHNQSPNSVNPVAYGAGGSDTAASIQACFDLIYAKRTTSGAPTNVELSGFYTISRPVWIKGPTRLMGGTASLEGNLGASARLSGNYAYGPSVLVADAGATIPGLVTSLATGSGNAWQPTNANDHFFNLRDAATCELNGLGAFAVECFYKHGGNGFIAASGGLLTNNSQFRTAFALQVNSNQAKFALTTTGGSVEVAGGTLSVGTTYHIAGTWDGTTVRLFVGGTQVGSSALGGTLVQYMQEDVRVNGRGARPDWGTINAGFASTSTIDSLRLSNVARYTSGFTAPTAKFTNDANTLALLNFDLQMGNMTRAYTKDGDAWLPMRQYGSVSGVPSWEISNVCVSPNVRNTTSGIYVHGASSFGLLSRVNLNYCRYGFMQTGSDSYPLRIENVEFSNVGRYGIYVGQNATFCSIDTIFSSSCGVFGVVLGSAGCRMRNAFIQATNTFPATPTVVPLTILGAGNEITGLNVSTEGGVASEYLASIVLTSGSVAVQSMTKISTALIESAGGVSPILYDDAGSTNSVLILDNCFFHPVSGATPTAVLALPVAPKNPVLFIRPTFSGSPFPLSPIAGCATLAHIGKGSAIAFATPLTLDCSLRDDFELAALTGAITINFSNVTPGQKISLWTVQNAGGGNAITFGTVNGTGAVKGATANDTTGLHYSQYLFDCNLNGNMTQIGFSSGA